MIIEFAIVIGVFLVGYCLGKFNGRKCGSKEGASMVPLLLRQQSYELGYCVLCQNLCKQNIILSNGGIIRDANEQEIDRKSQISSRGG